ncbi:MAG: radical SAM protein [Candidatus Thorarchaeota archaeon]|nr:MAG: radical SAM protein [Candidatus Thorarchaeota archaeon]
MPFVFGPVPSRRLGLSLGIDLIPSKTCTYDCLYCQVGRTTSKTIKTASFAPVGDVIDEIEMKLGGCDPDVITLSGSGEPTLNSDIEQVIAAIKKMTEKRVVLLTNGSLFWKKEIRKRALNADIVMPTLTSAFENTFREIHRPHPKLKLDVIIDGLETFRRDYKGQLFLEVVMLAGINDSDEEIESLKMLADRISPDMIHLNTVVRPPADSRAMPLDRRRLEDIRIFLGNKTEIVAGDPVAGKRKKRDSMAVSLLDMIRRRPLKPVDISNTLSLSLEEVEGLVKGLVIKGYVRKQEHSGEIYYVSNLQSEVTGKP